MTHLSSKVIDIPNALDAPLNSEKWCGDECTKYAVLKVEATSFVLAICVALSLVLVSAMFPDGFSLIGL